MSPAGRDATEERSADPLSLHSLGQIIYCISVPVNHSFSIYQGDSNFFQVVPGLNYLHRPPFSFSASGLKSGRELAPSS